jgi:hypothetical protein
MFFALWKTGMKPLVAIFGIWLAIALHEGTWWIVDAAFGMMPNPLWLLMGWLFAPCVITLIFYVRLVGIPTRGMLLTVAAVYAFWAAIGFPVTVNWVPGGTVWYYNPWVNLLENASWDTILVGFWVFERPRLKTWSNEVERLVKVT